ncbi:hypothetical protein Bca101_026783 [Brassica carinata]
MFCFLLGLNQKQKSPENEEATIGRSRGLCCFVCRSFEPAKGSRPKVTIINRLSGTANTSQIPERLGSKNIGRSSGFCHFLFRSFEPAKGSRLIAGISKSWSRREVDPLNEEDVKMKQIPDAFPWRQSPQHHPTPKNQGSIANLDKCRRSEIGVRVTAQRLVPPFSFFRSSLFLYTRHSLFYPSLANCSFIPGFSTRLIFRRRGIRPSKRVSYLKRGESTSMMTETMAYQTRKTRIRTRRAIGISGLTKGDKVVQEWRLSVVKRNTFMRRSHLVLNGERKTLDADDEFREHLKEKCSMRVFYGVEFNWMDV